MNAASRALVVALFVCCAGWGYAPTIAEAQTRTGAYSTSIQVTYYLIQVQYAFPRYGYYGGYSGYSWSRYSYAWITIAETTDPEEAEFIYGLYELAWQLGVLDEVAPDYGYRSFPVSVRMITEVRTVQPTYSSTLD